MKHSPTKLLDQEITPTDSARNLGVVFDGGLNFRKHISLVCRSCYYHIRDLRRLRRCLTSEVSKTIATALVSSKLDYCNGLLYNVTNRELNRLQGVQNCLARVVTRSPRFSRTTPLLKSLHWLPVCFRIKFKICLVTYKVLCNNQPIYLKEMLEPPKRTRDLRSSDQNVLFVHRIKTEKGEGYFSVAAPKLWIISPVKLELQNSSLFQKKLKTLYFTQAFPTWFFCVLACSVGTQNEITTTVLNTSSDFRAFELGTLRI